MWVVVFGLARAGWGFTGENLVTNSVALRYYRLGH